MKLLIENSPRNFRDCELSDLEQSEVKYFYLIGAAKVLNLAVKS